MKLLTAAALALGAVLILSSCERQRKTGVLENTFTLASGVEVLEAKACDEKPESDVRATQERPGVYKLSTVARITCGEKPDRVFLTVPRNRRATLIVESSDPSSPCECFSLVTVRVVDRVEQGETLYVISAGEVAGHVVLP